MIKPRLLLFLCFTFGSAFEEKTSIQVWRRNLYDEFSWSGVCCEVEATKSPSPGKCRCYRDGIFFKDEYSRFACYYPEDEIQGPQFTSFLLPPHGPGYMDSSPSSTMLVLDGYNQTKLRNIWMEDLNGNWRKVNPVPFRLTNDGSGGFDESLYLQWKHGIPTSSFQGKLFMAVFFNEFEQFSFEMIFKVVGYVPEYRIPTTSTQPPSTIVIMTTGKPPQKECLRDPNSFSDSLVYALIAVSAILLVALVVSIILYMRIRKKYKEKNTMGQIRTSIPPSKKDFVFSNPSVVPRPRPEGSMPPTPNEVYEELNYHADPYVDLSPRYHVTSGEGNDYIEPKQ